jgi:parallel beta-helix repeat protein
MFLPGNNLLDDLAGPSRKIAANFVLYFIATEMIIMRKLRIALIIFFTALFATSTGWAATYYVDKANSKASNINPGTESAPWLTIQKAADVAKAGDTVLVKSGIYNEWVEIKNSGSAGKPITFKAYPGHKPVIDGTGINVPSDPYWKALIYSIGKSYITIDGFEVRNSDEVLIRMRAEDQNSPRVSNLIVRNSKIHGNSQNDRNGVHFEFVDHSFIENNECYDSGWNCISLESCNNVDIQRNYVHNNPKHAGINVFPKTYEDPQKLYWGNDILYNVVSNIGNPGAAVYTRFQTDNVIMGNLINGNSTGLLFDHNHTGTTYIHAANTKVLNNTIVNNGYFGFRTINASNVTLKNNIIAYNGSADVAFESGTTGGSSADYNHYYSTVKLKWGATTYTSLSSWASNTSNDQHSRDANPAFVNLTSSDFALTSTSPAIDAGSDVSSYGLVSDLSGKLRPQGKGYDLGAYEYGTAVVVSPPAEEPSAQQPPPSVEPQSAQLTPSSVMLFMADSGVVTSPMTLVTTAELAGKSYIKTSTSNSGTAAYSFTVDQPGTYKIVAEVFAPDQASDSFGIKIDNGPVNIWDLNPKGDAAQYNVWMQKDVTGRGTGTFGVPQFDPLILSLAAGTHTITISGREPNARLAYFYIKMLPATTDIIEAESGVLTAPMQAVASAEASGSAYIVATKSNSGSAVYNVNIVQPGTYKIVADVYAPNTSSDSFLVKIDSAAAEIWDLNPTGDRALYGVWRKGEVTGRGTGTLKPNLAAGAHTITFSGREPNARLDKFQLVPVDVSPTITNLAIE